MRTAVRGAADYWTHPENKANKDGGREGKGLKWIETNDIV